MHGIFLGNYLILKGLPGLGTFLGPMAAASAPVQHAIRDKWIVGAISNTFKQCY